MRALVTGASSGIGLALAGELAERGYDLVLAARHDDLLDAADALRRPGIEVTPVRADLATAAGVDQLAAALAGRPLAVAALNAGTAAAARSGPEARWRTSSRSWISNVRGTVHLADHVTGAMVARGEGRILFTSSIAANMPGPFDAVYNASKSFVQSFALALRNELKDTGVTVTSLMPGPSDTALFEKAGMGDTRVGAGPGRPRGGRPDRRRGAPRRQGAGDRELTANAARGGRQPAGAGRGQGRAPPADGGARVGAAVSGPAVVIGSGPERARRRDHPGRGRARR